MRSIEPLFHLHSAFRVGSSSGARRPDSAHRRDGVLVTSMRSVTCPIHGHPNLSRDLVLDARPTAGPKRPSRPDAATPRIWPVRRVGGRDPACASRWPLSTSLSSRADGRSPRGDSRSFDPTRPHSRSVPRETPGAGLRSSCPSPRLLPRRVAVGGWSDRQVSMMARQAASRQRSFAPRGQAGRLTAKAA